MDTQPSNEDDGTMAEHHDWSYTSLQQVWKRLIAAAVVIVLVGAVLGLVTYAVRAAEDPTYEAVARFAISPNATILSAAPADQIESVAALDRPIVNATVSELLQSGAVAEAAAADIGLSARGLDDYDFDASEVPGAAIVRLSITGPDADTVSALAAAVRDSDESLANDFIGVFDVRSIDRADLSSRRVAPSPTRDALAVALAAMIAAGAAAILFVERVRRPIGRDRPAESEATGPIEDADPSAQPADDPANDREDTTEASSASDDDVAASTPSRSRTTSGGRGRRPSDHRQGATRTPG